MSVLFWTTTSSDPSQAPSSFLLKIQPLDASVEGTFSQKQVNQDCGITPDSNHSFVSAWLHPFFRDLPGKQKRIPTS